MSFEVISGTVAAFGMMLPSPVEVRHHDPRDERRIRDLRLGIVLAAAWAFVIAAHSADKSNSAKPYLFWIIGVVAMSAVYEGALRMSDDVDLRGHDARN